MVKDPDYREAMKHRQISIETLGLFEWHPYQVDRILVNNNKFFFLSQLIKSQVWGYFYA